MDDTPWFNKKASAKEDKITQNKVNWMIKLWFYKWNSIYLP